MMSETERRLRDVALADFRERLSGSPQRFMWHWLRWGDDEVRNAMLIPMGLS